MMKKENKKKFIEIRIVPIILCIIIILTIINLSSYKTTYEQKKIKTKNLYTEQEYQAMIGENYYKTLEEAIEGANENDEIVLLNDITINASLTISKNLEINLNEKEINIQGIINNAELKLSNGKIYCNNNTTEEIILIDNTATLSLESILIHNSNSKGYGVNNKGTLNLEDASITIVAKTPIQGKVNSMRNNNYAVKIDRDANNTSLNCATIVNIYGIDTNVYTILSGNILYNSMSSTMQAIGENNTDEVEIKLLGDVSAGDALQAIGASQKIKLNLNSYTLTTGAQIVNNGNLTIENGTIKMSAWFTPMINNKGNLNINEVVCGGYTSPAVNLTDIENTTGTINITGTVECTSIQISGGVTNIESNLTVTQSIYMNASDQKLNIKSGKITGKIKNNQGTIYIGEEDSEQEVIVEGYIENLSKLVINNGRITAPAGYVAVDTSTRLSF